MAETNQYVAQAKQFWAGRSRNQRILLGVVTAATLALVVLFATMMSSPDMKVLMSGLESADAQTISSALAAKKIPYQLSPDGKSISVPADQLDAARMEVASAKTTNSGRLGFEIFDKVSWGQTEFDEKVNYQRALEGELERTIMTISGVKSARVHLVLATQSVFIDRDRGAKASVTLQLAHGGLTREQTLSIQRLVSGAVEGLKPGDVSIIDADTNESLGGVGDAMPGEEGAERQLTQRLIATLSPVVGADGLRASVNVEYDPGTSEEHQEKYDPAVAVPLVVQRSDETSGGAGVGGVPGTTSNVPQNKPNVPPPVGADAGQSSKTENTTYGVNKTVRNSVEPAGRIRRITAALVVDDVVTRKLDSKGHWLESRVKRTPQDLQQIQALAQSAIGIDSTRGDVLTVSNLAFAHAAEPDVVTPTLLDKARKGVNDYATVVRYGMLLILFLLAYLLMLRPLQKKALAGAGAPELAGDVEMPDLPALPEAPETLALAAPAGPVVVDATRALALKEQVNLQVRTEPANSARLVQAWLRGEGD